MEASLSCVKSIFLSLQTFLLQEKLTTSTQTLLSEKLRSTHTIHRKKKNVIKKTVHTKFSIWSNGL